MRIDSAALKNLGLKVTGPRMKILDIFYRYSNSGERHLSAEDVYSYLKAEGVEVGLATIYRVLSQFVVAGILRRHHFENDCATYELGESAHHDHLVCVKCGKVEEFVDHDIERRQSEIAAEHGFKIRHHTLCLFGVCAECQKNSENDDQTSDN